MVYLKNAGNYTLTDMTTLKSDYKLHSKIGVKVGQVPALKLWYLCRSLDTDGSGRIVASIKDLQSTLSISQVTLSRYLNDQRVIRGYKQYDDKILLYLHSVHVVSKNLSLEDPGAIGYTNSINDLVGQSIHLQAIGLQQQSYFAAINSNKVHTEETSFRTKYDVVNPILSHFSNSSDNSPGAQVINGIKDTMTLQGQPVLLMDMTVLPYGASQKGIAECLDVCVSTVQRHLKDTLKIRIAHVIPDWYYHKAQFEQSENLGIPVEHGFMMTTKHGFVKAHTYLYYPFYQLASQKKLREKIARQAKMMREEGSKS